MTDLAARLQQGIVHHRAGRLDAAGAVYREVLKRAPNALQANNLLGLVLMARGDAAGAVRHIGKAVAGAPKHPEFARNLAVALHAAGRFTEALKASETALLLAPGVPEVLSNHGMILRALGRLDAAAERYRAALDKRPDEPGFNVNYANVLLDLGEVHEAERFYSKALGLKPDHSGARSGLGLALSELGRHEEAIAAGAAAVEGRPGDAILRRNLAKVSAAAGRTEAARAALREAVRIDPRDFEAWGQLTLVERLGARTEEFAGLESQFAGAGLGDLQRAQLRQAVSVWTDDLGEFVRARDIMIEANGLRRGAQGLSIEAARREIERVREMFEPFPGWRGGSAGDPIFIVGLPRSGKSTLEGMLGRHSGAQGVGELRIMTTLFRGFEQVVGHGPLGAAARPAVEALGAGYLEYVRRLVPEGVRSIDTMPSNYLMVGMIALACPGARIIHCVRDPLDHAIAMFIKHFKGNAFGYSYELEELAEYYRRYRGLMAYWHRVLPGFVLDVDVSALGGADEGAMRLVLEFCGLGFEAACLEPHVSEPRIGESAVQRAATVVGRRAAYAPVLGPVLEG